ncbi:MAG: hypothetical protein FalmKO_30500 [Falsiruegeria mediterranea]
MPGARPKAVSGADAVRIARVRERYESRSYMSTQQVTKKVNGSTTCRRLGVQLGVVLGQALL